MALKNKKSLGQHWLKNREILDEIAELAAGDRTMFDKMMRKNDDGKLPLCLEIGPGLGTLTSSLLKRFDRVVAVEYDADLAAKLPKSFPGTNLEVVHDDILEYDFAEMDEWYRVAGNIPYYITKPIIEKILSVENPPRRAVLLVQKEVAEKVAAARGKHSPLSLWVEGRAKVKLGPVVKASEFTPAPEVDSQVLILDSLSTDDDRYVGDNPMFFELVGRGFRNPRKKLLNNFPELNAETLKACGVDPNARPETLTLEDWCKFFLNAIALGVLRPADVGENEIF